MSKQFTVDDIVEITDARWMMGVEAYWIKILFKGCKKPVEFYASPIASNDFAKEMYDRLKAGEFCEWNDENHGFGEHYITQPKEQHEVEAEVIAKRNQLLLESDYTEFPSTQERLTSAEKTAWADYRQALRDLTDQAGFPWDPEWPVKP